MNVVAMPALGQIIQREREAAGWSRRQLAEASGVRESTVEKIEFGYSREPGWAQVRALASALGLSADELFEEADEPPAERRGGSRRKNVE